MNLEYDRKVSLEAGGKKIEKIFLSFLNYNNAVFLLLFQLHNLKKKNFNVYVKSMLSLCKKNIKKSGV